MNWFDVVKTHSHAENTGAYRKLLPSVETITSAKSSQHMVDAKLAAPPGIVFSDEAPPCSWEGGNSPAAHRARVYRFK
jgi:hypothetical protein